MRVRGDRRGSKIARLIGSVLTVITTLLHVSAYGSRDCRPDMETGREARSRERADEPLREIDAALQDDVRTAKVLDAAISGSGVTAGTKDETTSVRR